METSGSNIKNDIRSELNGGAHKAQRMGKSISQDVRGQVDSLVERASDVVKRFEPEVKEAYGSTMDFVRSHPVAFLCGAAALGYAIVSFTRRSRR